MHLRARHYATGQAIDVACEGGRIAAITPATGASSDSGWIAPALFDLQINGCDGHSFNSERLTADSVRHVVEVCRKHGIGALCPTLVTNSFEALAHGMATLRQACEGDAGIAAAVLAIHLEGPYISSEDGPRGAHPRQHVRPPDWDEFRRLQDASGGRIRLHTLAAEHTGAIELIERLVASGVVVALGHTAASPVRIREAIAAGAKLSTHLGNGSHAMLPRHENYIWEQLAADELWASLIADGHHLPASVVRCIVRVKTPVRTVLSAMQQPGLAPKPIRMGPGLEIQPSGKVCAAGTSYLAAPPLRTCASARDSRGVSLARGNGGRTAELHAPSRTLKSANRPTWCCSTGSRRRLPRAATIVNGGSGVSPRSGNGG